MKKTYIIPNVQAVTIATQPLLAGSPLDTSSATPQQTDFTNTTTESSNNLARGWFDDDDED